MLGGMEMMFKALLESSGIDVNEQVRRLENLGKLLASIDEGVKQNNAKCDEILAALKASGLERQNAVTDGGGYDPIIHGEHANG